MLSLLNVVLLISISCFYATSVLGLPSPSADDPNEPVPVGPEDKEQTMRLAARSGSLRNMENHPPCISNDTRPEKEVAELTRNGRIWEEYLWKGRMDVYLDPGKFPGDDELFIRSALSKLQDALGQCIKIRVYPHGATPSGDYVHVYRIKADGCYSFVGRAGGRQPLNLADGCLQSDNIILHEFMHALGLSHEQNRPDRDQYIIIHWENIDPAYHVQFERQDPSQFSTFGLPYEYESNMHYNLIDYSWNGGRTMTAKTENGKWEHLGPNSRYGEITELDRLKLRRMYNCGDEW